MLISTTTEIKTLVPESLMSFIYVENLDEAVKWMFEAKVQS